MKKSIFSYLIFICVTALFTNCSISEPLEQENFFVVAYISGGEGKPLPNFDYFTHLNYAFGRPNKTFDGVDIENITRFEQIAQKKIEYNESHPTVPPRKMLLSIGGWGTGRFSEMVSDSISRNAFVLSCKDIVDKYQIDGIDLDWEYPSSGVANISFSESDVENFTLLVKELKEVLGSSKLLTIATICTARFIDFAQIDDYIDFYNIMSYDMDVAPYHHSPLRRFDISDEEFFTLFNLTDFEKLELGYLNDQKVSQMYDQMYKTPIYYLMHLSDSQLKESSFVQLRNRADSLARSLLCGQSSLQEAVMLHLSKGISPKKLTLGIPFYGKVGGGKSYPHQATFSKTGDPGNGYIVGWDSIAQVPYVALQNGDVVFGYEDSSSISAKCNYIKERQLLGGMYWEYCIDTTFVKLVAAKLLRD